MEERMDTPVSLQTVISETRRRWAPFKKPFAAAEPAAKRAWQEYCRTMVAQHDVRRRTVAKYEADGMHPLLGAITADRRYRRGLERFRESVETLDIAERPDAVPDTSLVHHLTVHPLTGDSLIVALVGSSEEALSVFGPPYAGQSRELRGGPHQQQSAVANRTTGRFSFLHNIGEEGGWSFASAALWVHFMRESPGSPPGQGTTGLAQIRVYVPFSYLWTNESYIAPAHNHAGFGVFITSQDIDGGDRTVEMNHQYWIFSDGTSWYQQHNNPAFPGTDADHALTFNHQAPWFLIRPGRMYSAAVWCFGECDAHGATIEQASFAGAGISARMPFLVLAQTKN
jgi:hypothetical protein